MADAKATNTSSGADVQSASPMRALFPYLAIAACAVVAYIFFYKVCGNPANFADNDPAKGHPHGVLGTIFKGGFIIPIGLTLLLTMFTFTVERMFTILKAAGSGNLDVFVQKVRMALIKSDIEGAVKMCDTQSGSVGNVVKAGLRKYREMEANTHLDKEEKKAAIHAELEEATMLELPSLERNLSVLATIASLGTLVGLIGTVMGMIRSFQALGAGGAPNAAELSVGISEALVNTAIGITTSALAILCYNFFTTRIDAMTYRMEEVGYSIVQTFDQKH